MKQTCLAESIVCLNGSRIPNFVCLGERFVDEADLANALFADQLVLKQT